MDSDPQSDSGTASMEVQVEVEAGDRVKKRKRENGKEEGKRVAEIVLVLSAMARMRGGKDPTAVEKAMMKEAREKVVSLCEQLAPKDILPRESFGVLIDDLGLNRLKEQRLGFRTPKLSISEKLAVTKRRMEESKTFVAQPSSHQSQRSQNPGVATENRATPPNVRVFSSDKTGQMPISAGNLQPTSSVPPTASAFRPPGVTEVPAAVVSSTVPNNMSKDSTTMVSSRVDRAHVRPDGRLNGPSFVPHVPVSSAPDQRVARTTNPVPHQPPQSGGPWVNNGMQQRIPEHLPGRTDGNAKLSAPQMTTTGQTPRPVVSSHSHSSTVSKPPVHQQQHPIQGMHFAHVSPGFPHHLEIAKLVQKELDPKLAERPVWTPPSRDYMNKAIMCQFCKVTINGVENVLVCDACEKGFHVGCLQSYNAKGIPRVEWHCPRCLAMNRGKPFPPKYGRVTRNMNASKAPPNTAGMQSLDKKSETADEKINHQPNAITNGNVAVKTEPQAIKVTTVSSYEPSLRHGNVINEKDMSAATKKDDKSSLVKSSSEIRGAVVEASVATSTGSSGGKPCQQSVNMGNFPEEKLVSKIESMCPSVSGMMNPSNVLPTSSGGSVVHQERLSNGAEPQLDQYGQCNNGGAGFNKPCDGEGPNKDVGKQNLLEKERPPEASESNLPSVSWIGGILRILDTRKFFQSCCINGVVYKVHDYALFSSGNGKLTPLKIQGMWEDSHSSSKWLIVHKCYFPDDLPKEVGRPGAPQSNEVYESTHDSNVMASVIQGPCEVLPFRKFGEETERSNQGPQTNDRGGPVFIRNWFYDETKRAFCPSAV